MSASARAVAEVLSARGFRGVVVQHGRRLARRPVRTMGLSQCGTAYVGFDHMLALLEASLSVCFATYRDEVFLQTEWLPIGGALSDLGAGLLLGFQEAAWRWMPALRRLGAFGHLRTTEQLDEEVAQCRCVDDVITLSSTMCVWGAWTTSFGTSTPACRSASKRTRGAAPSSRSTPRWGHRTAGARRAVPC